MGKKAEKNEVFAIEFSLGPTKPSPPVPCAEKILQSICYSEKIFQILKNSNKMTMFYSNSIANVSAELCHRHGLLHFIKNVSTATLSP